MRFQEPKQVLDALKKGDLYNYKTEEYVFLYNDRDAVCCYDISAKDALDLIKEVENYDEYWSAFLGVGGSIYDAVEDIPEEYRMFRTNNYDFMAEMCYEDSWYFTHSAELRDLLEGK